MWLTIPFLAFRGPMPRPELSGPAESVEVDRFRVWFTREGRDAPNASDADGDGIPDLVEVVTDTLAAARAAYDADGWRTLGDDDGAGGSAAIDVYLEDIDANGYAIPAAGPDGTSCFVKIAPGLPIAGRVAESVVAHELHHCVQFRYTLEAATWVYEAAATTEQYARIQDPALDYALAVLWKDRLDRPDAPIDLVDGRMEYAAFAWMKYWWERDGADYARLPALWEALARTPAWGDAIDAEAERLYGEDLGEAWLRYAEWNGFACAADDGRHYLSDPLGCIGETSVPVEAWDGEPIEVALEPFTAAYLERPSGLDVRCDDVHAAAVGDRVILASDVATVARCSTFERHRGAAAVGCSTAGGGGLGAALALLACAPRRSRRRR